MLLEPRYRLSNLLEMTAVWIREQGCKAVILDADNTLSEYGSPHPDPGIKEWIAQLKADGIPVVIASNNTKRRVVPLAQSLKVPYVSWSMKPFLRGLKKACRILKCNPSEIILVGDQLFTDILGGNRLGMTTVMIDPAIAQNDWFGRARHRVERFVLRRMDRRKER